MKTAESLQVSIGRILNENLQLDMPRPVRAKMKVVREIIELIESYRAERALEPSKKISQSSDAYYNRDKLFERKK